jgi:drug/metabolite transporter (DMT)-like permease
MAFYRVLFTTLLLLPLAGDARGQLERTSRRDLLLAGVAGLALAAHFAAWFESVDRTTIAASTTLVQTQPVFVAIGAYLFLDERITRKVVGGILVAIAGVVTMSGDGLFGGATAPAPILGNALAVLGAVTGAAYWLSGRSIRQRLSLVPYVLVVYSVATAGLLASLLVQGQALLGYPAHEWALFLGMAVGPGILGHTLINWALEHVESSVVSVSLLGEPVGSTALAVVLLSEVPSPVTVAGGSVVLVGIALAARSRPG